MRVVRFWAMALCFFSSWAGSLFATAPPTKQHSDPTELERVTRLSRGELVQLFALGVPPYYYESHDSHDFRNRRGGEAAIGTGQLRFLMPAEDAPKQFRSDDFFDTQLNVTQFGNIFDIGEKSCRNIAPSVPGHEVNESFRHNAPFSYFAETEIGSLLAGERRSFAKVKVGHCYLLIHNDVSGRVMVLFHVKEHEPRKRVLLDEIDVLERHDTEVGSRPY